MKTEFYVDELAIERAIKAERSFNVIHLESSFKADIFTAKAAGFNRSQLERRILEIVVPEPPRSAWIATAEDIVLAKLDCYRKGNEVLDQQWRDVMGVMRARAGELDVEYMKCWADELKVADLLKQVLAEGGVAQ